MLTITIDIVRKLIHTQFPAWANLDIKPVARSGHDNIAFHLGQQMSVRLPSAASYVPQVEKEQRWLPILSKELSYPISTPLAKGEPNEEYLWSWSINQWIEGEPVSTTTVHDLDRLAKDLGTFLVELQSIDASGGPLAGQHIFFRGGSLAVYDEEARTAIENNRHVFDRELLENVLELALNSKWNSDPVWVHGDIAPGNLLVQDGKLCAVIDFGILCVGNPSCDAAMTWIFFDKDSNELCKKTLNMGDENWNRARG